jgi:hypothetical protein
MGVHEARTISFADAEHRIQALGIVGVGTLLRLGEEIRLAGPPQFASDAEGWRVSSAEGLELSLTPWAGATALGGDGGSDAVPARAIGTVASRPVEGLAAMYGDGGAGGDVALERMLAALFEEGPWAVVLTAERPRGAAGHGEERLAAVAFRGDPMEVVRFEGPRLSSTYDAGGLLSHAGLELWESEDADRPTRIGGEALARGELAHPDGKLTRVSFLAWHHNGLDGLGSYTITPAA